MNIKFYLPRGSFDRCFATGQIDRLAAAHHVVLPKAVNGGELLNEWVNDVAAAQVLVTGWGTPPLTHAMLDQAERLQLIVHAAGSVKAMLPADFWDRGVRVTSCRQALAVAVAETALGLILVGLKGVFPAAKCTAAGHWRTDPQWIGDRCVREMHGMTIGLVGASSVGRELLRLLRAFSVQVQIYDPYVSEAQAQALGARKVELDDLMATSDVVTLHAADLPETRGMIGGRQLAMMKDQAILINTARGALIDQPALVDELRKGRLFAFLDVTSPEPPAADHPLRTLPNVVLTPHIAGPMSNGCRLIGEAAVGQIEAFVRGVELNSEITREAYAILA